MEPAERGATRIADRVVAKIASQAAREALSDAAPPPGHPRDGAHGGRPSPYATVAVRDDSARVRVSVELGYPADLGARCAAVRRRIVERVRTLAGMDVPEVVVTVERLHSAQTLSAGRERVR
ncbi:Asp23/Gls24 family envelope stress response protein [Streptomyces sp. ISL-11]|uniref:Asp23/Gls24 family envelope stress response protein n=1 Tax=Streptomyces sp. ISL-11 TaxID=2819174 RepID=UPI001BECA5BD|nr:Asp23/Gls24 family envelope stress response protein [Streptomyces sp. ISL-11]MBT2384225.1 Asp23/Gls24 family envelope stress response protein [Streptomyces sp. ISL-11]